MSTLWLVCDVSGSMREAAKNLVVLGLVLQLEQYVRFGYAPKTDIQLVAWNGKAETLRWHPGAEVPAELLACVDSADGKPLLEFLADHVDDKFLVLTDGFWPNDTLIAVKQMKSRLGNDAIRIVKVGTDANPILTGSDVFGAEDFFAAMEGWLSP